MARGTQGFGKAAPRKKTRTSLAAWVQYFCETYLSTLLPGLRRACAAVIGLGSAPQQGWIEGIIRLDRTSDSPARALVSAMVSFCSAKREAPSPRGLASSFALRACAGGSRDKSGRRSGASSGAHHPLARAGQAGAVPRARTSYVSCTPAFFALSSMISSGTRFAANAAELKVRRPAAKAAVAARASLAGCSAEQVTATAFGWQRADGARATTAEPNRVDAEDSMVAKGERAGRV